MAFSVFDYCFVFFFFANSQKLKRNKNQEFFRNFKKKFLSSSFSGPNFKRNRHLFLWIYRFCYFSKKKKKICLQANVLSSYALQSAKKWIQFQIILNSSHKGYLFILFYLNLLFLLVMHLYVIFISETVDNGKLSTL